MLRFIIFHVKKVPASKKLEVYPLATSVLNESPTVDAIPVGRSYIYIYREFSKKLGSTARIDCFSCKLYFKYINGSDCRSSLTCYLFGK